MSIDYKNQPKVDFAVFKNDYTNGNPKAPPEVGKIEMTREFMKAITTIAKTGTMPVLKVAMWYRESGAGVAYKNFRLEIDHNKSVNPFPGSASAEPAPVETAPVQVAEESKGNAEFDLPF
tara:strand:- start:1586 stop:1945 length:360 start_codon:yes stop_codon:yes gene_type:complete